MLSDDVAKSVVKLNDRKNRKDPEEKAVKLIRMNKSLSDAWIEAIVLKSDEVAIKNWKKILRGLF